MVNQTCSKPVRSVAGRIIDRTVNGVDPNIGGSNYTYDGAGRLTAWSERDVAGAQNVSGTYSFAYAGGTLPASCTGISGVNVLAGLNSNRTTQTVTQGGSTTTTTFCYDFADRLRKVDMSAGTNPYTAGFVFDAHGNVTTSGNQTLVFDGANRHVSSTAAGTTVAYVRDASNRIVSRAVNGTVQERYVFTGAGDNSAIVTSTSNVVKEFVLSLAGGVSYTWRPSSAGVWSLPNTHGDIVATTNTTGVLQGGIASFDPFGNPLGTTGVKDNSDGNLDYSWHGTAQRGLDHETGMQPTINMGARPYQPGLGRFLGTDPVEGGTPNDYLYVADPIGDSDLTGLGGGGGISQARSRGSKAKKKLQDACSHGDNDSCRELERAKDVRLPGRGQGC
jgi:RHS repeat-associated protein